MERQVDLGGREHTETITQPSRNWAQCKATSVIEANALTATPCRHHFSPKQYNKPNNL